MSYSDCSVVNTWGIIESCHFKPTNVYASYNSIRTYPQFRGLIDAVKSGKLTLPSIFCHPNAAREFVERYLDHIDFPFVLVTSHGDSDMPLGALTNGEISQLINNRFLVRWYTQNCVVSHPKITSLAIGLDYHTLTNAHPTKGHYIQFLFFVLFVFLLAGVFIYLGIRSELLFVRILSFIFVLVILTFLIFFILLAHVMSSGMVG